MKSRVLREHGSHNRPRSDASCRVEMSCFCMTFENVSFENADDTVIKFSETEFCLFSKRLVVTNAEKAAMIEVS